MASKLAEAQLTAQARLRAFATNGVGKVWTELGSYDEEDVDVWLKAIIPFVNAVQRQSILLTDAYVARSLGRQPLGLDTANIIGSLRGPVTMEQVYRRAFVEVWTALSKGVPYKQAVADGMARAQSMAAMDIQMAHRAAMQAIQDVEPRIKGWKRAANPGACSYCQRLDGAFVKRADAMPMHNYCGCGLEVVTTKVHETPLPDGVAVHDHGEYGPTIADPDHQFSTAHG